MRLVTFEVQGARHAGVALDVGVVNLAAAGFTSVLSVLQAGSAALQIVQEYLQNPPLDAAFPIDAVRLCAPIPNPPKLLCVGLNYRDHAREAKMDIPVQPTIFAKFPNTLTGSGDAIVLPKASSKPDYEAEFAFVIGNGGRYIEADNWRDHVFGYMNMNDVSARDFQMAVTQWTMGKNFDTFAPMGPWLVTADEIPDPHNLNVSLTVNGEQRQSSNTRELIFKIPDLIEFLSGIMTLEPGDIISTGTPAGVGMGSSPPKWLTPGAEVVVEVQGLGRLCNVCVAEA
jgi:2-keto-4-pentenoate hydratase/2-oxohepta-3-ene-1,7-dioic acid hydratase in catechol pathway